MIVDKQEDYLKIVPKPVLEVVVSRTCIRIWHGQNSSKEITPEGLRAVADEMQALSVELREAADFAEKIKKF